MEASVAEVTEQHLVLVLRLVTLPTLLTVSALPLIAGHELKSTVNNPPMAGPSEYLLVTGILGGRIRIVQVQDKKKISRRYSGRG